jgi:hypothetical protein
LVKYVKISGMDTRWAKKRRFIILGIFMGLIVGFVFLFVLPKFENPPTCFDGQKNETETGIDCGGACQKFCTEEAYDLKILWSRVFPSGNGLYLTSTFIQNDNRDAGVESLPYKIALYDASGLFVTDIKGDYYIMPNGVTSIVSSHIDPGSRIPVYAEFSFLEVPDWRTIFPKMPRISDLRVGEIEITDEETEPKVSSSIENIGPHTLSNIHVVAVAYNNKGNALGVTRTVISRLRSGEDSRVVFSWSTPFLEEIAKVDILPHVDPFQ